ncbi:hypothetical protein NG800_012120 [Epilithonimonas ginsengisoli]|uniref:Uncharacterized protein n=1 Tax=Epilithonimonas ginsengisoli TaxID=1245592 RepID=A0ABU4JJ01_9FLAO|nr:MULTISPECIES: hypothetical protein [Chryseobacterium group]MBV6880770.1 hypothetical protein [Epilithonimonas sp. FP105]MDW8549660.1 hypothetical protein [Epilithonimonas ginsengisoli]OAH76786.1 hypothetical protein AXA65_00440 [Chryseobacterium sp. FP211-J200]
MGQNTLTAIVLKPENADFNEQYRALTTQEGQGFTIGIKEYVDGKKGIDDRIANLENEKRNIDTELQNEEKRLYEQAQQRFKEGGKWTEAETHNGESVSHAQVSLNENVRLAKNRAERLKRAKDNQLEAVKNELKEFDKNFESVVWAWNLAHKRSDKPNGRNEIIQIGTKEVSLVLGQHLYGGGFAWIEPFYDGSQPTGNAKSGLFIHTAGASMQIITAEWYGFDKDQNPVKIDKSVAPGSKVQLHIYTKSMYGHNIRVELKSNGKTLKANTYGTSVVINANKKEEDPATEYGITDSKDLFLTEVEIHDYSDPKSVQPPSGTQTGTMVGSDGNDPPIPNVQKAILDVYIDPAWCAGQAQILIKPTIHFSNQRQDLNVGLTVNCRAAVDVKIPDTGNMPVFVDNIETNIESFHPCGYSKFEINDGSRTVDLLGEKSLPPLNLFELVAGPESNTQDITIDLDTDTTECSFDGSENDHEKHALSLIDYPEKQVENDAEKEEESSTSRDHKIKVQIGDKTNVSHEQLVAFSGKLEKYTADGDDKQLKFKARYIYNYAPINLAGHPVHPIFRYFWLGNGVPTNTYLVKTNTCRYQQNVAVKTYPDVGWSLKLSYTNSTVEKEIWKNKRFANRNAARFQRRPQKWIAAGEDKSIGISLGAKWDKDNEFDATADITEQIKALCEKFGVIGRFVNSVFLGQENSNNSSQGQPTAEDRAALESVAAQNRGREDRALEQTRNDMNSARAQLRNATTEVQKRNAQRNIERVQRDMDRQSREYKRGLTRSIASVSVQWPQIEAQFEWSLENIDQVGPHHNQVGVVLRGVLELTPLIGITATLDFLALAQRAHPVALAVIAAADITMALIGDGSKITCELSAAGNFGGKLQGFLNTKTGENSFNKNDRNANDKQVTELKCDLEFKLKIAIDLAISTKKLFVKVTVSGKFGADATAKWTGKAPIDADDFGWYLAPEMTFEGLEVKGYANISAKAETGSGTPMGSVGTTNEFTWQAIDAWKEPKKWDKMYLCKSE